MNKTELIHQIMMLGAETYEKTHSDRYNAQLKAEKLLDEYFCEKEKKSEEMEYDGFCAPVKK